MRAAAFATILVGACSDGAVTPVPAGAHHHYVVDRLELPTNNETARSFALDLNQDSTVDNQLGMVIATLAGQGFEIQPSNDRGVATGELLMLVDVQTDDFVRADGVGLALLAGADPSPTPCTGPGDLTCRHHLDGTGSFTVAPGAPRDPALVGKIRDGTLISDGGALTIQIALGGPQVVELPLIGARVKLTGISETHIATGVLAGGVTLDTLDAIMIPAFFEAATFALQRDCPGTTPPACGCRAGSPGATIVSLFDDTPADCALSFAEIDDDRATRSLLAPDLKVDGASVLSLGVGFSAVPATFDPE